MSPARIDAASATSRGSLPTPLGCMPRHLKPAACCEPIAKERYAADAPAGMYGTGLTDPAAANSWLEDVFLPRHNERFAVPAAKNGSLFRRLRPAAAAETLAFRYAATVGNDNAVRLGGLLIDVPPGPNRRGYAKARVEVRQWLDGSWRVYYQKQCIAIREATELRDPLKAHTRRQPKGAADWTWVYRASAEVTT